MNVKVCPSCGHEIYDRGRFCQFCGCELKGGVTVSRPEEKPAAEPAAARREEGVWDPEKAYGSGRRAVSLLVLIILLVSVAAGIAVYASVRKKGTMKIPELKYGMSFSEARKKMKSEGFSETGAAYSGREYARQMYGAREVFGTEAQYAMLEVQEGGYVALLLSYNEEKTGSMQAPGPVFRRLEEILNAGMGKQYNGDDGSYRFWQDEKKAVLISYVAPDEVQIIVYFTSQVLSL